MAQYKVPQDVEAEDKLLGPFSFRQFVYLLIAGGLAALAVGLFQLFPLLVIIPIPPMILLVVLALPLKKDQPMETYLAALVSYYLKPRTRLWTPGQRDSVIKITAPKIIEESRTRDISGEEANHRLSFLADIVDTGGYAIKGSSNNVMREDLVAEANATVDMFEGHHFDSLGNTIQKDESRRHEEVIKEMHEAMTEDTGGGGVSNGAFSQPISVGAVVEKTGEVLQDNVPVKARGGIIGDDVYNSPVIVLPEPMDNHKEVGNTQQKKYNDFGKKIVKPSIIELANNADFSVQTIAKQANKINEREGEVFISLH